jgi:hypothetical protein
MFGFSSRHFAALHGAGLGVLALLLSDSCIVLLEVYKLSLLESNTDT